MSRGSRCPCSLALLLSAHLLSPAAFSQDSQSAGAVSRPRFVRLKPGILDGSVLKRKDAVLPPLPPEPKIEPTAVLELTVDPSGAVRNARPVSVHRRLRDEGIRAAREWPFAPRVDNGKPACVIGTVNVKFIRSEAAPDEGAIRQARAAAEQDTGNPARHYELATLYDAAAR